MMSDLNDEMDKSMVTQNIFRRIKGEQIMSELREMIKIALIELEVPVLEAGAIVGDIDIEFKMAIKTTGYMQPQNCIIINAPIECVKNYIIDNLTGKEPSQLAIVCCVRQIAQDLKKFIENHKYIVRNHNAG